MPRSTPLTKLFMSFLAWTLALSLTACQSSDGPTAIPTLPDSSFQLDTSFNSTGTVPGVLTTTLSAGSDTALAVAIQSDGKIVTAGSAYISVSNSDVAVMRYNSDGSLDTAGFNALGTIPGVVTTDVGSTNQAANAIALQGTGLSTKIIVAGFSYNTTTSLNNFLVARYNYDGSLDTTFNAAGNTYDATGAVVAGVTVAPGMVTVAASAGNSRAQAIAIQGTGEIVVAGTANNTTDDDIAVVRLNSNGTLDTGFNTTGIVIVEVNTVYAVGTPANDSANAIQIDASSRAVIAGTSNGAAVVVRLNTNGSLDTLFGNGAGPSGITLLTSLTQGNALVLQAGSLPIIGGAAGSGTTDMAVARLTAGGALDNTFNAAGAVPGIATVGFLTDRNDVVTALALQADGKIVAGGGAASGIGYDFALIRLHTDGTLDTDTDADPLVTFGLDGQVSTAIGYSTDTINAIAIQGTGEIVAAGGSWLNNRWIMALARYLPDIP